MQQLKSALAIALITAAAGLTGCASIVSDSKSPVSIMSSPAGSKFEVRNESGQIVHSGITPGSVTLAAGDGYFDGETYTITFSKDGMDEQVVTLETSINGWYWGNLLIGGIVGMLIVDPATGAMYKLPESVSGTLHESTAASGSKSRDLTLITIDEVPESELPNLVKL